MYCRPTAFSAGCFMEIDEEKVDEAVLALLYLTTFKDKPNGRAWKGHNFVPDSGVIARIRDSTWLIPLDFSNRAMTGDRLTDLASRTLFTESLHPTNKPRKNTSHPTGEGQS
jgi:hypothetical protein